MFFVANIEYIRAVAVVNTEYKLSSSVLLQCSASVASRQRCWVSGNLSLGGAPGSHIS